MISLTPQLYTEIGAKLMEKVKEGGDLFNGRLEYDTDEFYSTLTCTLIVYRDKDDHGKIENIVPVWWSFSVCAEGVEEDNDFSWREFREFLFLHG